MDTHQRIMLRAANRIHDKVTTIQKAGEPDFASLDLGECQRISRWLRDVQQRGWQAAANSLRQQLAWTADECRRQLDAAIGQLSLLNANPRIASPKEIFEDLVALEQEFSVLTVDLKGCSVSVETDSIVLDGQYLGPFEIELRWKDLDRQPAYHVIAKDPIPAAGRSNVTHPHVEENQLCAGDGSTSINQALQQGRLLDFFVLVRQILDTYNSASAFVSLEDWDGYECSDCASRMIDEDRQCCERCDTDVCCECSTSCLSCDRTCCHGCVEACPGCGEYICNGCLYVCKKCHENFCQECVTDDTCKKCRQSGQQEQPAETAQAAPS